MQRFQLTENTALVLSQGDITRWAGDAIVNAANEQMLGGGGVDGAIHRAAGPGLTEECERVAEVRPQIRCPTGEARITSSGGGSLAVPFVIHTVGPIYQSPDISAPLLRSAYRNVLELANDHNLRTLAFPAISCGVFGYPLDQAAQIAIDACAQHAGSIDEIHFILFGDKSWNAWQEQANRALRNV